MPEILVVDDELEVGSFFKRLLQRKGHRVHVARNGKEAYSLLDGNEFQVALLDLKLPDTDGLSVLQRLKTAQPYCEAIIMTGYSTTRTAVKAIQMGAFDYIEKPFADITEVEDLIAKALEFSSRASGQPEWLEVAARQGFQVGPAPRMQRLVTVAHKIAPKNINILIQGETGTGKELLARFIHACSPRSQNTFIPVNCGALQESLLESELFGHEKGAFTGASARRRGIFEIANRGTLFLDEIGEASLAIQVKLLRVLETGEFFRVGGEESITTDVRVIAATNVDLQKAVEERKFREDLFYRLDVVRLEVPPLRERKEDIPLLVNHFLQKFSSERSLQVSPEAMQILKEYSWPGNVRELANVVRQAAALVDGNVIVPSCLSPKILDEVIKPEETGQVVGIPAGGIKSDYRPAIARLEELLEKPEALENLAEDELLTTYRLLKQLETKVKSVMNSKGIFAPHPPSLMEVEKQVIKETLQFFRGNVTSAARSLGIGRNTLYRKIKEYGLNLR